MLSPPWHLPALCYPWGETSGLVWRPQGNRAGLPRKILSLLLKDKGWLWSHSPIWQEVEKPSQSLQALGLPKHCFRGKCVPGRRAEGPVHPGCQLRLHGHMSLQHFHPRGFPDFRFPYITREAPLFQLHYKLIIKNFLHYLKVMKGVHWSHQWDLKYVSSFYFPH